MAKIRMHTLHMPAGRGAAGRVHRCPYIHYICKSGGGNSRAANANENPPKTANFAIFCGKYPLIFAILVWDEWNFRGTHGMDAPFSDFGMGCGMGWDGQNPLIFVGMGWDGMEKAIPCPTLVYTHGVALKYYGFSSIQK